MHWVEADVQPSSDLVPVLFHDDTLGRTTDGDGLLREQRLVELAALDAGGWRGAEHAGERIPTLHEFLSAMPTAGRVLLEIKGPHSPAELIAELAVIRATATAARVWLHSFEVEVLRELAEALPGGWLGLLRDEKLDDDPVAACRQLAASSYHPEYKLLLDRPEVVAPLHAAGLSVIVYTADDPDDWQRITEIGVDGIITNRPVELLAWQHDGS